jgi:uridine phosphorylase
MIPQSELVLTPTGAIYHLALRPEQLAHTIIAVGDQDRVAQVSKHFDKIDYKVQHREFVTHTGWVGKKHITAISSGIGTDNIDIMLNELDALVNIDFQTRLPKENLTSLQIVRVGTSGALQPDIEVDSLLVSKEAIGLDNLMMFYNLPQTEEESAFCKEVQNQIDLPFLPYCVPSSPILLQMFDELRQGITLTCSGFYAPQGRRLRLNTRPTDILERYKNFQARGIKFTNFEMETSGYYAFGCLLQHEILSLNAILANRATGKFSSNPAKPVEDLIQMTIEKLCGHTS